MISEAFHTLAGVVPEPLFLLRPDGRILAANAAAWAMLELEDGAGAGLADFAAGPDDILAFLRECARSERSVSAAVLLRSASGRQHPCRCTGARVGSPEGPQLLVHCGAEPEAAEALRAETRTRAAAQTEMEQALRELRHGYRNNLQVLLSMLGLAAREEPDERARARLMKLRSCVLSMSIVQRLARATDGVVAIDAAALIGALCAEIAAAYPAVELQFEAAPVTLGVDVAGPLGLIVCELVWDALQKAPPEGGRARLGVGLSRAPGGEIELVVDDAWVPADPSSRQASAGLNLAHGLAGQLGGELLVESVGGRGTRRMLRFADPTAPQPDQRNA